MGERCASDYLKRGAGTRKGGKSGARLQRAVRDRSAEEKGGDDEGGGVSRLQWRRLRQHGLAQPAAFDEVLRAHAAEHAAEAGGGGGGDDVDVLLAGGGLVQERRPAWAEAVVAELAAYASGAAKPAQAAAATGPKDCTARMGGGARAPFHARKAATVREARKRAHAATLAHATLPAAPPAASTNTLAAAAPAATPPPEGAAAKAQGHKEPATAGAAAEGDAALAKQLPTVTSPGRRPLVASACGPLRRILTLRLDGGADLSLERSLEAGAAATAGAVATAEATRSPRDGDDGDPLALAVRSNGADLRGGCVQGLEEVALQAMALRAARVWDTALAAAHTAASAGVCVDFEEAVLFAPLPDALRLGPLRLAALRALQLRVKR